MVGRLPSCLMKQDMLKQVWLYTPQDEFSHRRTVIKKNIIACNINEIFMHSP